ncbi:MAG: hypothetical protein ACRD63_07955 [Pyrinomonadaceae bacterium]
MNDEYQYQPNRKIWWLSLVAFLTVSLGVLVGLGREFYQTVIKGESVWASSSDSSSSGTSTKVEQKQIMVEGMAVLPETVTTPASTPELTSTKQNAGSEPPLTSAPDKIIDKGSIEKVDQQKKAKAMEDVRPLVTSSDSNKPKTAKPGTIKSVTVKKSDPASERAQAGQKINNSKGSENSRPGTDTRSNGAQRPRRAKPAADGTTVLP